VGLVAVPAGHRDAGVPVAATFVVRTMLGALLLGGAVLGGCGLSTTPFSAEQSCQAVGGSYGANGQCAAGNR
jgi:hypothetical protein